MRNRDSVSWSRTMLAMISTVAGVVPALVMSSGPALAQEQPLDGVSPSSSGMPGAALVRQLLSWGFWLGLAACGGAIIYGAATWRGMGTNAGRGVEGKTWVAAGCIGALIIGLAPTIVSTFFSTGSAG